MRTSLGASRRAIAMVGIAGVVCLGLGAGGGAAGAQPVDRTPPTQLTLAVVHRGAVQVADLTCEPPGGSHPEAAAACRDIAAAGGNLADLPGDPDVQACPDVYDPVAVLALGRWRGQPVWYGREYGNACELRGATGPVFALGG